MKNKNLRNKLKPHQLQPGFSALVFPDGTASHKYTINRYGKILGRFLTPLKTSTNRGSYERICLQHPRLGEKNFTIHSLVAATYLPNPHKLPQINHLDGDKTNNQLDNLEWTSRKDNMAHARGLGLWSPEQNYSKHTSVFKGNQYLQTFPSRREAERFAGVHSGAATACIRGRYKNINGFIFKNEGDL
jgi:hypothetical protein